MARTLDPHLLMHTIFHTNAVFLHQYLHLLNFFKSTLLIDQHHFYSERKEKRGDIESVKEKVSVLIL